MGMNFNMLKIILAQDIHGYLKYFPKLKKMRTIRFILTIVFIVLITSIIIVVCFIKQIKESRNRLTKRELEDFSREDIMYDFNVDDLMDDNESKFSDIEKNWFSNIKSDKLVKTIIIKCQKIWSFNNSISYKNFNKILQFFHVQKIILLIDFNEIHAKISTILKENNSSEIYKKDFSKKHLALLNTSFTLNETKEIVHFLSNLVKTGIDGFAFVNLYRNLTIHTDKSLALNKLIVELLRLELNIQKIERKIYLFEYIDFTRQDFDMRMRNSYIFDGLILNILETVIMDGNIIKKNILKNIINIELCENIKCIWASKIFFQNFYPYNYWNYNDILIFSIFLPGTSLITKNFTQSLYLPKISSLESFTNQKLIFDKNIYELIIELKYLYLNSRLLGNIYNIQDLGNVVVICRKHKMIPDLEKYIFIWNLHQFNEIIHLNEINGIENFSSFISIFSNKYYLKKPQKIKNNSLIEAFEVLIIRALQ